jgi:hypothetical protein
MRDIEKQIVYTQVQAGHRSIEELSGKEMEELKVHWFNDHYKEMPPFEFHSRLCAEQRRREVGAASKPLKPIDRGFFK